MILPTREAENALLSEFPIVVGIDEVGRGALAGPVCVGAAIVDRTTGDFPAGLRDSKLLTAPAREAIVGAAAYALLAWRAAPLGAWHAGYIDLRACLVLVVGSWLGIQVTSRWIGKIPDRLHAKIYIALLCAVLLVMVVA